MTSLEKFGFALCMVVALYVLFENVYLLYEYYKSRKK